MSDGLGAIEVDARAELHRGLVFFQHRTSRFTVAVDRESGEVIGASSPDGVNPFIVDHVMAEVGRYQGSRKHVAKARAVTQKRRAKAMVSRFGARLRERGEDDPHGVMVVRK